MSEPTHHKSAKTKSEHGTTLSYVIGFILSLVFTAIPYYLVVHKSIAGSSLLATILGFGVLQMLVQIFFFLHLGRGPKPFYNIVFFVSTVGIILVVVGGSVFIMNNLHYMESSQVIKKLAQDEAIYQLGGEKTGACQQNRVNHIFTVENSKVTPSHIEARLCDTLTFINNDSKERNIVFGAYPEQQSYAGQTELTISKMHPDTITLNQSGRYQFYDHFDPAITGDFNVAQQ